MVYQTGAARCQSGDRRGSGLVQALRAVKNIRLLWPGVIWGPGIPLPRLFIVITHLFFSVSTAVGVPSPRRKPSREDALRWVHSLCLLQQGYDGEMAVRSAGCTLTPPCTLLRWILFTMPHALFDSPLSLLAAQRFFFSFYCAAIDGFMLNLVFLSVPAMAFVVPLAEGAGWRCGTWRVLSRCKCDAFSSAGLCTKERRAASCGCAASAVLLVAITRSSAGAEAAARASVARQPCGPSAKDAARLGCSVLHACMEEHFCQREDKNITPNPFLAKMSAHSLLIIKR